MQKGKSLEAKLHNWCKEFSIYHQRFYDSRSFGRVGSARPADFWLFIKPQLIFIECKEGQGKSLAFGNIAPSQYKAAKDAEIHGYKYLFLIELQKKLFFLKSEDLFTFISESEKKSINTADLTKIAYIIDNKTDFQHYLTNALA